MIIQYSYKKLSSCKSRRKGKRNYNLIYRASQYKCPNITTQWSYKHNDTTISVHKLPNYEIYALC